MKLYTQIQLLACFMLLVDSLNSLNEEETRSIDELRSLVNIVEVYLKATHDRELPYYRSVQHNLLLDITVAQLACLLHKYQDQ